MENGSTTKEKLSEALKLLDEAAKEKKGEVQSLVKDKYTHLREAVFGFDTKKSIDSARKNATEAANKAREAGEEKVKEIATQVDQNVHANPWPYIGGVALCSLLLGLIIGRKD